MLSAVLGSSRRNADDAPPSLFSHRYHGRAGHQKYSTGVDRHQLIPYLERHLLDVDPVPAIGCGGVVNKNVKPAISFQNLADHARRIRFRGYISLSPGRSATGRDDLIH